MISFKVVVLFLSRGVHSKAVSEVLPLKFFGGSVFQRYLKEGAIKKEPRSVLSSIFSYIFQYLSLSFLNIASQLSSESMFKI